MKELSREESLIIKQFLEPYKETLEEILISNDTKGEAQRAAYTDWAVDLIMSHLGFTEEQSKTLLNNLEEEYKLNQIKHERYRRTASI